MNVVPIPSAPTSSPAPRIGLDRDEPSRLTGFSGNRIDRQSETRGPAAIAEARRDRAARLYVFREDRALLKVDGDALDPLFAATDPLIDALDEATLVLLGHLDGAPRLAATLPADTELPESIKAIDLRSLAYQGLISDTDLGAIAQARALTGWHTRHRFCANCGAPTTIALGGYRRDCANCDAQHFPRTDPVVIMLITDGERALLGRSHRFAEGMFSCLAGFVEPGETIEDAVRREIFEESGIHVEAVHYHASQPWPFVSSLMIGCFGAARSTEITIDENELEAARWFDKAELRSMLSNGHPDGLFCPPKLAIAHELIQAFVED